jgi:chemotaxis protein MotC
MRGPASRLKWLMAAFAAFGFCSQVSAADGDVTLPIYKMVRSLETVQDKIVSGDLQAADMQRFMLGEIDRRLREATPSDFKDLKNIDAALIYAMSGGNPATLDLLISRDVPGNFDSRVTNALLMYMGGKGSMATKSLEQTVPEYKTTAIGPYLALVAANAIMQKNPKKALEYFDWARLVLPGTIVEEAALRRSMIITVKSGDLKRSEEFARRYLTRFPISPYAAQVADQLVTLVVGHFGDITEQQLDDILGQVDARRKQEVYLRIARKAAVTGKLDLAKLAAQKAIDLGEGRDDNQMKLARLYLGLSGVPTADIAYSKGVFADIPAEMLGPGERKLLKAGEYILSELGKPPSLDSLTQAADPNIPDKTMPEAAPDTGAHSADVVNATAAQAQTAGQPSAANGETKDKLDAFLSQSQQQLDAIDAMIKKGDM